MRLEQLDGVVEQYAVGFFDIVVVGPPAADVLGQS